MEQQPEVVLRVKSTSNAASLASAVAHAVYEERDVTLRAIGPAAVNVAVKAIAIARGFVAPTGVDLSCVPGFVTVEREDGPTTAIILKVIAL
jgi:stage V sporulation protein S